MDQSNQNPGKPTFIPYNTELRERAREMRKKPTPPESKMWELLISDKTLKQFRFLRQKPIDQYIVDFYCSKLKLAIEIDGPTHLGNEAKEYDRIRAETLSPYGINVIRFTNDEVLGHPDKAISDVIQLIRQKSPNPPLSRG
jgi:very-short-patch-repair endonuclease